MGFWDTIKSGISTGIGFLSDHAGDIATAAKVIGTVASVIIVEDDDFDTDDGGSTVIPKLNSWLTTNEGQLTHAADMRIPQPSARQSDLVSKLDLHAILPNPVTVFNGEAPASLSYDINKFLSLHNLPTTMGTGPGAIDLGQSIGQKMLADIQKDPQDMVPMPNKYFKQPPNFKIGPDQNGYTINGGHIYYPIPLDGHKDGDQAWHSILRLWPTVPDTAKKAWANRNAQLTPKTVRKLRSSNVAPPYNSTTVVAEWTTNPATAPDIMAKAVSFMTASINPAYDLNASAVAGQSYKYQFQTLPVVGPSAVLQTFEAAIRANLSDPTSMPGTEITNQDTIIV